MSLWADPSPSLKEIDSLIERAFRLAAEHMANVVIRAPSEDGDVANGIIAVRNSTNDIVGFAVLMPAPMDASVFVLEAHMNTQREPTEKDIFDFAFVVVEGVGIVTRSKKVKDLFVSTANPEGLAVSVAIGASEASEGLFRIPGRWLQQTIAIAASAYRTAKAADIH